MELNPEANQPVETWYFKEGVDHMVNKLLDHPVKDGHLPVYEFVYQTHEENYCLDISVDYVDSRMKWNAERDVHPASLLTKLVGDAKFPSDVWVIADHFSSEKYKARSKECLEYLKPASCIATEAATKRRIGEKFAEVAVGNLDQIDEVVDELFKRLGNEETSEFTRSLVPGIERAFQKRLLRADSESKRQAAKLFWPLEEAGLLLDESKDQSILSSPKLLAEKPYAEMLIHRLARRSVESDKNEERQYNWLGRLLVKEVLERYKTDPARHKSNIEVIQAQLFSDNRRPDAMNRDKLIQLSNQITSQLNERDPDNKKEMLDPRRTGVTAEAFLRILKISSLNNISDETHHEHRLEDRLYAELYGMLLEQRHYQPPHSV